MSDGIAGLNFVLEYDYEKTHDHFFIPACRVCILFCRFGLASGNFYVAGPVVRNDFLGASARER
jgi:hypothetical protein